MVSDREREREVERTLCYAETPTSVALGSMLPLLLRPPPCLLLALQQRWDKSSSSSSSIGTSCTGPGEHNDNDMKTHLKKRRRTRRRECLALSLLPECSCRHKVRRLQE